MNTARKLRAVVYMENDEKKWLRSFCESRGLTIAETGRLAIEEYIKRRYADRNRFRRYSWNRPRLVE